MKNRLLTLCVLLYPPNKRSSDGEMLRDLASELAEEHGTIKEAAGLARGGLRARFQQHCHRIASAPWNEAFRKILLPLATIQATSLVITLLYPNTSFSLSFWLAFAGWLTLLIGAVIQWRLVAGVGAFTVALITMIGMFSTLSSNLLDSTLFASEFSEAVMLGFSVYAAYTLPRFNVKRISGSVLSFRIFPVLLVIVPVVLYALSFLPIEGRQVQRIVFALYGPVLQYVPILIAITILCQIRRRPAAAFGAFLFLEVLVGEVASTWLTPSPYSAVTFSTVIWVVASNIFLAVALLLVAGKISDIAARRSQLRSFPRVQ